MKLDGWWVEGCENTSVCVSFVGSLKAIVLSSTVGESVFFLSGLRWPSAYVYTAVVSLAQWHTTVIPSGKMLTVEPC